MENLEKSLDVTFNCQCCGRCCEGSGGIVLSEKDLKRLCSHMNLTPELFEKKWAERANGKLRLKSQENGGCVFYNDKDGCSVHVAKPDICRAWPYFRGNLLDNLSLEMAKEYCPGIPKEMTFTAFVMEGLAYLKENELMSSRQSDEANALYVADIIRDYSAD